MLSLGGCFMPSGINPTLGCNPHLGCQQKDFYLPGKGYWAPKPKYGPKATIGALIGAGVGALAGSQIGNGTGKLVATAAGSVTGLVFGHSVGETIDKVDQMWASRAITHSFNNNTPVSWQNKKGNFSVTNTPTRTIGKCRDFTTDLVVNGVNKQIRGTACRNSRTGEWEMTEPYYK